MIYQDMQGARHQRSATSSESLLGVAGHTGIENFSRFTHNNLMSALILTEAGLITGGKLVPIFEGSKRAYNYSAMIRQIRQEHGTAVACLVRAAVWQLSNGANQDFKSKVLERSGAALAKLALDQGAPDEVVSKSSVGQQFLFGLALLSDDFSELPLGEPVFWEYYATDFWQERGLTAEAYQAITQKFSRLVYRGMDAGVAQAVLHGKNPALALALTVGLSLRGVTRRLLRHRAMADRLFVSMRTALLEHACAPTPSAISSEVLDQVAELLNSNFVRDLRPLSRVALNDLPDFIDNSLAENLPLSAERLKFRLDTSAYLMADGFDDFPLCIQVPGHLRDRVMPVRAFAEFEQIIAQYPSLHYLVPCWLTGLRGRRSALAQFLVDGRCWLVELRFVDGKVTLEAVADEKLLALDHHSEVRSTLQKLASQLSVELGHERKQARRRISIEDIPVIDDDELECSFEDLFKPVSAAELAASGKSLAAFLGIGPMTNSNKRFADMTAKELFPHLF